MQKAKKILFALAITMSSGIASASAQIYVNLRPSLPVYIRTEAPSPRHVWVGEEWRERDGRYEWNGGHWVEPPHEGDRYNQGYWRHSSRGDRWQEGHWGHGDNGNRGDRGNRRHGEHEGHRDH